MSEQKKSSEEEQNSLIERTQKAQEMLAPITETVKRIQDLFEPYEDELDWFDQQHIRPQTTDETGRTYTKVYNLGLQLDLEKLKAEEEMYEDENLDSVLAGPEMAELITRIEQKNPQFRSQLREAHQHLQEQLRAALPAVQKEVADIAKNIRTKLDYRKIVQNFGDYEHQRDFFSAMWDVYASEYVFATESPELRVFLGLQRLVQGLQDVISEHQDDMVNPDSDTEEPDVDLEKTREAFAAIPAVKDQIDEYRDLYRTYKMWGLEDADLPKIGSLALSLEEDVLRDGQLDPRFAHNPQLLRALLELYQDDLHRLRAEGVLSRDTQDPSEYLMYDTPRFDVVGLDERPGQVVAFTKEKVFKLLFDRKFHKPLFPCFFLEGLGEIQFVESNFTLEQLFGEPIEDMVGRYGIDNVKLLLEAKVEKTVVHEVFEHVVTKLTYDEMIKWEEALATDESTGHVKTISSYARSYAVGDTWWEQRLAKKEDFCDSGSFFMTDIYRLYTAAPARYEFMIWFFRRHLPPELRDRFEADIRYTIMLYKSYYEQKTELNELIIKDATSHEESLNQEYKEKVDEARKEGRMITAGEYTPEDPVEKGKTIKIKYPVHIPIQEGDTSHENHPQT